MLFIVSTPIGNIKDITLRALEVLAGAEYIFCEDTRKTGQLLKRYIEKGFLKRTFIPKLISYYEENEDKRIPQIIDLVSQEKQVVLVSNAGTPTISDPGFKLIRACVENNLPLTPIPGPSAITASLATSGLSTDKFIFLGFLPKKQGKRQKIIQNCLEIRNLKSFSHITFIIFESPFRAQKTLNNIYDIFGDIKITVARELTKKFEQVTQYNLKALIDQPQKFKGELTILF